jgi:hypothetical protein
MVRCLRPTSRPVTRRLPALALLALASCARVDAEDEPTGDIALETQLSAPTRGQRFTTLDGYVITVERFALLLKVNDEHVAVARGGERALLRGLPAGTAPVFRLPADDERPRADWEGWNHFEARDRARLDGVGLVSPPDPRPTRPTVLVALRAEGNGPVVRLDLALSPYSLGSMFCGPQLAVGGAGSAQVVDVRVEALFSVGGVARFASFARADSDGDGFVSERELAEGGIDDAEAADAHAMVGTASGAAAGRGCEKNLGPLASPLGPYLQARPTYSQNLRDLLLVRAQRALIVPGQSR